MSLKHALLGLISYQPMTGYEIKQFFDSSIAHFWNAELSQIYPALKALEDAEFVVKHVEVQENRPNRKIYEITDAGREEFLRWMRTPTPPAGLRDPFLIKIFLGTELPVEDTLVLMRRQMEEHQKVIAFSETVLRDRIAHAVEHEKFTTQHALYWTLTLEMALAYRRAYVEWCERAMRLLEESMLDETAPASRAASGHAAESP
ncbi:MAG TPA: PadR family transcriptional regulator [Dehalococcoidia bacterium]|nr:PadR family transcriptional regulator [Dehalococcoidia bacterium]